MNTLVLGVVAASATAASAGGLNVFVLSCGDALIDQVVESALEARGHTATMGPEYMSFDGTVDLSGYDVVFFQPSYNWGFGDMPDAGQSQLVAWVEGGGGLVTGEWVQYKAAALAELQILAPLLPMRVDDFAYDLSSPTYSVVTPDSLLNAGVPPSFSFTGDNFDGGSESQLVPAEGATEYYSSSTFPGVGAGVVGWERAEGRVLSISAAVGTMTMGSADFAQLLSNCMWWADVGHDRCRADFDGDGFVTGLDFDAFVSAFEAGDPSSDFDGDGFVTGLDFDAYVRAFEAGCD